ncbi:MAG: hypothetical protein K6F51_13290 [Acetatifactor sp.]|nr:hypothetical protein [Acetatifactor sp.]
MMDEDEEILDCMLESDYEAEKANCIKLVESFQTTMYDGYKRMFPVCLLSRLWIKVFLKEMVNIQCLPDKEEYISIRRENEIYEITLSITLSNAKGKMTWMVPYPISINKIQQFIVANKIKPQTLVVGDITGLLAPERLEELKKEIKECRNDLLAPIKKDNPIIIIASKDIVGSPYLINGNHRVVKAMMLGKETVEGYIFKASICEICGMTEGYTMIYKMMRKLYARVYGVDRNQLYRYLV